MKTAPVLEAILPPQEHAARKLPLPGGAKMVLPEVHPTNNVPSDSLVGVVACDPFWIPARKHANIRAILYNVLTSPTVVLQVFLARFVEAVQEACP